MLWLYNRVIEKYSRAFLPSRRVHKVIKPELAWADLQGHCNNFYIHDEMSNTGYNEYSLEQNGEMKSEQFVSDSSRDRRGHRLVAGSTTTCAIRAYHN